MVYRYHDLVCTLSYQKINIFVFFRSIIHLSNAWQFWQIIMWKDMKSIVFLNTYQFPLLMLCKPLGQSGEQDLAQSVPAMCAVFDASRLVQADGEGRRGAV